jgi:heat shock protein HslJ
VKKYIPFLLILTIILSACTTQKSSLTGTWKLVSYGSPDAMTTAVPEASATLTFAEDGTVGGSGGCNSLGGTYEVNGQTVRFSDVTSTLMACDEPRMAQEDAVTRVLSDSAEFETEGQTLTIVGNGITLVFAAVPAQ